jgi:Leucine-rich repeat (LRR) protein
LDGLINLEIIYCSNNDLDRLDLSGLDKLKVVGCINNNFSDEERIRLSEYCSLHNIFLEI